MRALWEATREWHHACEEHSIGQLMTKGQITPQQWADWLYGFYEIHVAVDRKLNTNMDRRDKFQKDFDYLYEQYGVRPSFSAAASKFRDELLVGSEKDLMGAAYVIHGAHRRGGAMLRKKMEQLGLPCLHTLYDDPKDAEAFVKKVSEDVSLSEAAVKCFETLYEVMNEIEKRDSVARLPQAPVN